MAIKQSAAKKTNAAGESVKKSRGFLNLAFPSRAGEELRLHAIPLNDDIPVLKQIADFIEAGATAEEQAERVKQVLSRIVGKYNKVRTEEEQALNLDF